MIDTKEMSAIEHLLAQIEESKKAYADLQHRYEEERKYSRTLRRLMEIKK